MSSRSLHAGIALVTVAMLGVGKVEGQTLLTGLGRLAVPSELETWGAIVGPDGAGLPSGRATAAEGRVLYDRRCAACHGLTVKVKYAVWGPRAGIMYIAANVYCCLSSTYQVIHWCRPREACA